MDLGLECTVIWETKVACEMLRTADWVEFLRSIPVISVHGPWEKIHLLSIPRRFHSSKEHMAIESLTQVQEPC